MSYVSLPSLSSSLPKVKLGDDKLDYRTASKLPVPTAAELRRGHEMKSDSLAKMVKGSKIDYLFDHPDKPTAEVDRYSPERNP